MRILTVNDFSCIKSATLEFSKVTLIIGPQASGKSVLCKLAYFLFDVAQNQFTAIEKEQSFEKFIASIKEKFIEWFPISAWGKKQFKIQLSAGGYQITLTRKIWKSIPQDDFRIKISPEFQQQYETLLQEVSKLSSKKRNNDIPDHIEFDWRFREGVIASAKKLMGKDNITYQAFVPAGRSFFTSIGKAIAAFEQGRVLDPLILRFGRLYTTYKDRGSWYYERGSDAATRKLAETMLESLLGGSLKRDSEKEYVVTADGRQIPLSTMSSGQQEILPLITFLPWLFGAKDDRLCYIEEPEAHLFPESQAKLIEALVMAANASPNGTNLVMTTHSPYVLTKANNLLKAGSIARKLPEDRRKTMEELISRRAWLLPRNVRAYAIQEGVLCKIMGTDGLIDADYLDEASGQLNEEFSNLLALEHGNA